MRRRSARCSRACAPFARPRCETGPVTSCMSKGHHAHCAQHQCHGLCGRRGDARRCKAARNLVPRLPGHLVVVPLQALGELHRVLVGETGRAPAQARAAILSWPDAFDVADSTFEAMRAALDLAADHQMPIWDALILSAASDQKCRLLLSEDFPHGSIWRRYGAESLPDSAARVAGRSVAELGSLTPA